MFPMLTTTHNAKIGRPIIRLVPVFVVHNFIIGKIAHKLFLHNNPMFKYIPVYCKRMLRCENLNVAIVSFSSTVTMRVRTVLRAILCNVFSVWVTYIKTLVATLACFVKTYIFKTLRSPFAQNIAQTSTFAFYATYCACICAIRKCYISRTAYGTRFMNYASFGYFHIKKAYHTLGVLWNDYNIKLT